LNGFTFGIWVYPEKVNIDSTNKSVSPNNTLFYIHTNKNFIIEATIENDKLYYFCGQDLNAKEINVDEENNNEENKENENDPNKDVNEKNNKNDEESKLLESKKEEEDNKDKNEKNICVILNIINGLFYFLLISLLDFCKNHNFCYIEMT
jgi:TATA-binding protein-associated factor Taf7